MTRHPHRQRRRRGAAIVEAAVVLPFVLLMLLGAFEYCRFIFLLQVAENAAREGARFAVARTGDGTTLANVQTYVNTQMAGRQIELGPGYQVEVFNADPLTGNPIPLTNWNDAPFGGAILVRVSGTYTPMSAGFLRLPATINVRATAMMSSEAN